MLAALVLCVLLIRSFRKTHLTSGFSARPVIFAVQGDVKHPGIYLSETDRMTVGRAIEAAGGLSRGSLNRFPQSLIARPVATGQRVQVQTSPQGSTAIRIEPMDAKARLIIGEKLDPNRATVDELCLVPRMNREFAEAIVARRQVKPWQDLAELEEIPGVGPKTVVKWHDYLEIGVE